MIKKFLKFFGIFLVFILLAKFIYSQGWYTIIITNSQSTATPAPFQQDIAICNGNPSVSSSFAYINNAKNMPKNLRNFLIILYIEHITYKPIRQLLPPPQSI